MSTLRLPPKIKVLEAVSAIAAGRVERASSRRYVVTSSDGSRKYTVYVDPEKGLAYSDDNGTRLRGYIGYPIIAALMLEGIIPYNERIGKALQDVPWRKLNEKYKKYAIVERIVKSIAEKRGVPVSEIDSYILDVLEKLKRLSLKKLNVLPLI